jgi:hypothetical protein
LKTRPIRSVSRVGEGRVAEGSGVGGGGRSDAAKWNRGRGRWASEGDAFRAGGNDINTLTAVVSKGWAKGKSAIPVRGPNVEVVGTGEGKTELAAGVKGVGGEVV